VIVLPYPQLTPTPGSHDDMTVVRDYAAEVLGWRILVKAGFEFDGTSRPRILWTLIGHPFQPDLCGPALLHDALYSSEILPRLDADNVFREALWMAGVHPPTVLSHYRAVRLCGGYVWWRHQPAEVVRWRQYVEVTPCAD
jgi:hypothetical protein